MIKMDRTVKEIPHLLAKHHEKWTQQDLKKIAKNPRYNINLQVSKLQIRAYKEMIDTLLAITKQHCAFCDSYPMGTSIKATIEHFKPKHKWPELARTWDNLFPACNLCQGRKRGDFDEKLLKPDVDGYSFEKYFEFDRRSWEIIQTREVDTSEKDKERARITIEVYKLNGKLEDMGSPNFDIRLERKRQYSKFLTDQSPCIDDYPYRFMF